MAVADPPKVAVVTFVTVSAVSVEVEITVVTTKIPELVELPGVGPATNDVEVIVGVTVMMTT